MTTDTTTRLDAIRALLESRYNPGSTHYDGCESYHIDCAARRLLKVVDAVLEVAGSHRTFDGEGSYSAKLRRLNDALDELEKGVPS